MPDGLQVYWSYNDSPVVLIHKLVILFWLSCFLTIGSWGQCSLSVATPIPDNGTVTVGFNVSGLVDVNLASPTQGICGVELSFNHEYVGDLTITLISPFGQMVTLIGPNTTAGFLTNLSTWNIDFTSCALPADPDPGFNDTWSNLNMWQIVTTYTGTYYPAAGCLEDFNFGPANGTWVLVLQDHDLNFTGTLLDATLIFCNPNGINCSDCIANGGILSPASFTKCAGERILSSEVSVNFGNNVPSASQYEYQFMLITGNTIVQSGSAFSATPPVGNYNLCGLSYLISDANMVNNLLANADYNALQQAIINKVVCANISTNCIPISILALPDTTRIMNTLCAGETFTYGGQTYNTTGTFYQVHDGPGMCDSIFEIRIAPRVLSVNIDPPDSLFCNGNPVVLNASATGASGPFNYLWTTTFGNILSNPAQPNVSVDQAAPYQVSVTDGLCSGVNSVSVFGDLGFPQVFVEGGTLNCNVTSVSLSPVFVPSNGTVLWSGPNGFTSNQAAITVTEPGPYIFSVTNSQGCSTAKSIDIGIDTLTFPINIYTLPKDCQMQRVNLSVATERPIVAFDWIGPNNFTSNNYYIYATDPGIYTVTTTFENGCHRSDTQYVDGDFIIPDLAVPSSDTLNCSEVISLTATSNTPGATFSWNWPNGFSEYQATTQIHEAGVYTAYVQSPNGCRSSAQTEIVQGPDVFDFTTFSDVINCIHDSVTIGVSSVLADTYHWINFPGPDSNLASIVVGMPGGYDVIMTDTNSNCVLTSTIFVSSDLAIPDFGFILDTVSCSHPVAHLSFVPYGSFYSNVYWETPDLTIVPGPNLFSSQPGENHLYAVGNNGCVGVKTISIPFDTISPFLLTESDSLICQDTARVIAHSLEPVVDYQWSGPGIISISGDTAYVDRAGYYMIDATGLNGCHSIQTILVDSNYVKPDFNTLADTLRCDRAADLIVIPNEPVISYAWLNTSGQLIDTDSLIQVNMPGQYIVEVTGTNRCIALDTIDVSPVIYPVIDISTDTLTCDVTSVFVESTIDFPPTLISWVDANLDTFSHAINASVTSAGPFYLVVTGQNGCISKDTILVPYDTLTPTALIELIGEVRCQYKDITFNGDNSTPANLSYHWLTIGGNIIGNPDLPMISAYDTGVYKLIVKDPTMVA